MKLAAIFCLATACQFLAAEESRTWTSAGGRTAEGALISKSEKSIKIRLTNGSEANVEIATLSVGDQQYIKKWKPTEPKRPIYVPEDAVFFAGSYYMVVLEKVPWTRAKKLAEKDEGHLAWVKNEETQEFIEKLAGGLYLWLGASDAETENLWQWTDGEKLSFTDWSEPNPNNTNYREHYLGTWDEGKWNDFVDRSETVAGYIVQWDP